jgi:hypothetical protein
MFHRSHLSMIALVAGIGLSACSPALLAQDSNGHGRKYKAPPPSAHIEVTVLRDFNGKPVSDAHVIFHPTEGDRDKGSLELKTNDDGKAIIDVIPIGDTVTLQVIADGYQTYGQSYKIDKPELTLEIRMKRPGGQYTIYKNTAPNSGNGSGGSSKPSPSAPPPASGDKPSGSGGQSNSNPPPPPPK